MNDTPDVVGTKEAARQLGVSVRTVQLWVEKGTLQAWKTDGGHRRILRSSVNAALDSRDGIKEKNKPQDTDQTSSALNILVVEDDVTVQSYYSALLDILCPDAHIVMVEDGYDALIELGKVRPNLLLVDVNLPHMDGVALLQKISNSKSIQDVQIAVVTGLSEEQLAKRGEIPQNIPVFNKPINIDNLRSLIEKLMTSAGSK